MRLWKYLYSIAIVGFFAAGCSSPVYVQKDDTVNLNNYRSYMWVNTQATQNEDGTRPISYADVSVRNAVNAELSKLGWREVSSNPDMLISYDVLVESSVEQRSDPVYSQSFTRWYYNPYSRRWVNLYYPSQFLGYQTYEVPVKEGTVTISMMDARTDKVVWQGWTTENMNYSRLTDDDISKSVRNIFNKFDVASR
jgi:hypothetical protein